MAINIKLNKIECNNTKPKEGKIFFIDLTGDDDEITICKNPIQNNNTIIHNDNNPNKEDNDKENNVAPVLNNEFDQNIINMLTSKDSKREEIFNEIDKMNNFKIIDTNTDREFNDMSIQLDDANNICYPKDKESKEISKDLFNHIDKTSSDNIKDTVTVRDDINIKLDATMFKSKDSLNSSNELFNQHDKMNRDNNIKDKIQEFIDTNIKLKEAKASTETENCKDVTKKLKMETKACNGQSHETEEMNNLCTTVIIGDVVLTHVAKAAKYLQEKELNSQKNTNPAVLDDIALDLIALNNEEETYKFQEIKYIFNFDDWIDLMKAKSQSNDGNNDTNSISSDDSNESDTNIKVNIERCDKDSKNTKSPISESSASEDDYDSSDFEFITEDEAKLGGIFFSNNSPNFNNQLAIAGPSRNIERICPEVNNLIENYGIPQGDRFVKLFEDTHQESQLRTIRFLENKCVAPGIPTFIHYESADEPYGDRKTRMNLRTYQVNKRRRL